MGLIGGSHDKIPGGDADGRNEKYERLDLKAMRVNVAALKRTMTDEERERIDAAMPSGPSESESEPEPDGGHSSETADRPRRPRPPD